jgi:hypothetical protein
LGIPWDKRGKQNSSYFLSGINISDIFNKIDTKRKQKTYFPPESCGSAKK